MYYLYIANEYIQQRPPPGYCKQRAKDWRQRNSPWCMNSPPGAQECIKEPHLTSLREQWCCHLLSALSNLRSFQWSTAEVASGDCNVVDLSTVLRVKVLALCDFETVYPRCITRMCRIFPRMALYAKTTSQTSKAGVKVALPHMSIMYNYSLYYHYTDTLQHLCLAEYSCYKTILLWQFYCFTVQRVQSPRNTTIRSA